MARAEKREAPDNWAGRKTQELMTVWLERLKSLDEPSPNARVYNAAWASAYEVFVRIAKE